MNTYGHTVTRVRAPLIDGYGGQRVRDWEHAARKDVAGSVQSVTVTEDATDRQVTTTDKRLNTGTEFYETDRVEWGENTYEVTGVEPFYLQGRLDHYEVTLSLSSEPAT